MEGGLVEAEISSELILPESQSDAFTSSPALLYISQSFCSP